MGASTFLVLKYLHLAYWKLVELMKKDWKGFQAKGNCDSPRIGYERQVTAGLRENRSQIGSCEMVWLKTFCVI